MCYFWLYKAALILQGMTKETDEYTETEKRVKTDMQLHY